MGIHPFHDQHQHCDNLELFLAKTDVQKIHKIFHKTLLLITILTRYPGHKSYPPQHLQTHFPKKKQSSFPRPNNFPAPPPPRQPADPGANVKLDYGGWTAIGFDDSLPGQKSKTSAAAAEPQIVTLDAAIAAAPAAQSDDLVFYSEAAPSQPAPVYETPAPAPAYQQPAQPAKTAYQPAAKKYQASSTYGTAVPAVPYIPSTADVKHSSLDYNNPAVAPAYEAPIQKYEAVPSYQLPAPAPKYQKPSPTPKYQKTTTAPKYKKPTIVKYQKLKSSKKYQKSYEAPVTSRPEVVVLPAYTPSPPVFSPEPAYKSPETSFGGDQFPIVALITADSPVPEDQKYVSFSIGGAKNGGSPDSLPVPGEYQATQDNTRLAKDVNGVYVQPATADQDELYYIYYQDPELDPSYGNKIQKTRQVDFAEAPLSTLDARKVIHAAPLADFPVYDYDEAREADTARIERAEPVYSRRSRQEPSFRSRSRYGTDFTSSTSRSSVSFTTSVGGKSSGFSYHL